MYIIFLTTKFGQLHYFYHNIGGEERMVTPCPKLEGTCPPRPLKVVPANSQN